MTSVRSLGNYSIIAENSSYSNVLNDECFDAFFSPFFASIVHKSAFKWHHCQTSPNNVRGERKAKVLFMWRRAFDLTWKYSSNWVDGVQFLFDHFLAEIFLLGASHIWWTIIIIITIIIYHHHHPQPELQHNQDEEQSAKISTCRLQWFALCLDLLLFSLRSVGGVNMNADLPHLDHSVWMAIILAIIPPLFYWQSHYICEVSQHECWSSSSWSL